MGIFGGGYDKPGKGVDKNAPKKKGFFLFWDIIIQKFVKFIQLNSLYSLLSIIWIVALYFFAGFIIAGHPEFIEGISSQIQIDGASGEDILQSLIFGFRAMFAVGVFLLWGSGPVSAAYSYIVRNYSNILLSSLVPVIGFTLSTLSLKYIREIWEKNIK